MNLRSGTFVFLSFWWVIVHNWDLFIIKIIFLHHCRTWKKVITFYNKQWLFCCINWTELGKNQPKSEILSKQGYTKKNTKAVLLTASSKYGVWQTSAYSILQCPHAAWLTWIAFTEVWDINFCSFVAWKSKDIYLKQNLPFYCYLLLFIWNRTYLIWSNWGGYIPQSPTVQLICSASKGSQSNKHYHGWPLLGFSSRNPQDLQKKCLGQPLEEGTSCIFLRTF